MDRLFSTQDVRPHNRFDYWYQVACKTIVEHDFGLNAGRTTPRGGFAYRKSPFQSRCTAASSR